jgi:hypothetical protein
MQDTLGGTQISCYSKIAPIFGEEHFISIDINTTTNYIPSVQTKNVSVSNTINVSIRKEVLAYEVKGHP